MTCFEAAASDIENGCASCVTVRSPVAAEPGGRDQEFVAVFAALLRKLAEDGTVGVPVFVAA